jgi:hypothetical protein
LLSQFAHLCSNMRALAKGRPVKVDENVAVVTLD